MRNQASRTDHKNDAEERRKRRLKRFAPIFRERIAALTCCAPEAEDLAESFPGLLVALVSDFNSPSARKQAFDAILNGGSIRKAAQILDLPLWLKKMPPEAFREPIRHLPCEAMFTAKITNFIPQKATSTGDWLEQVSFADEACDSGFALWVAKHCGSVAASRRKALFLFMASWAWHARHPETVGCRLIEKPWSSKMGLRRATEELTRWRRRVDLACLLDDGIQSTWLMGGTAGGYEFVPLVTLDDFITESQMMSNCLDQYADRLATGLIRVFSIRQGERRVADIEVGPTPATGAVPSIVQIKAANNRQASLSVWQAAQEWLEGQALDELPRRPGPLRDDTDKGDAFWRPYLDWLPPARRAQFIKNVLSNAQHRARPHLTMARPIMPGRQPRQPRGLMADNRL